MKSFLTLTGSPSRTYFSDLNVSMFYDPKSDISISATFSRSKVSDPRNSDISGHSSGPKVAVGLSIGFILLTTLL